MTTDRNSEGAFNVGDSVTWTSQAQGCTRTKVGEIVAVVPVGQRPSTDFRDLYRGGVGWGRSDVSYVVRVSGKHYWPRTSALQRHVTEAPPATIPAAEVQALVERWETVRQFASGEDFDRWEAMAKEGHIPSSEGNEYADRRADELAKLSRGSSNE